MIVPMKKVSVLTLKTHQSESLTQLRDLGVLHIFTDHGSGGNGINGDNEGTLQEQFNAVERTLAVIPSEDDGETKQTGKADETFAADGEVVDTALALCDEVQERIDEKTLLVNEQERLNREIERFAPWGDPLPQVVAAAAAGGVQLRLYEESIDGADDLISSLPNSIVFSRSKFMVRVVAVAIGEETFPELPPPMTLPVLSVTDMKRQLEETARRIEQIDEYFASLVPKRSLLKVARQKIDDVLTFLKVAATFETEKEISWINGFAPVDVVDSIREAAKTYGWGLAIRDPAEDEQVPTKIRNPKPIGIIRPVFDLIGTVPGYREMDISFFFLVFFVIFFAIIFGDGGYGLLLLLGTGFVAIKGRLQGKKPGPGTALMLVLSSATIIWGAVTGNWFGYAAFGQLPVLNKLVIPGISIESEQSTEIIKYMCFIIGTVHLSIAHIWGFIRALRKRPRIAALAQLGWLSMVLGLYYLILQLVLDPQKYPMPDFALYMIVGGLLAVILFGEQADGSNFFAGIGRGLAGLITTALDGVSAFSDIISYIRLFAVGLATLAIAEAFNGMAGGIAEGLGGVTGGIAAVLVLFLGHSLNLAMGALSVVVHGVRLNMLEFSGHLGMEWTGVEYAPFKTR